MKLNSLFFFVFCCIVALPSESNALCRRQNFKTPIVFVVDADTITLYGKNQGKKKKGLKDTIIIQVNQDRMLKVLLHSRKGSGYVWLIDSSGIVRKEGSFSSSKGKFKEYYTEVIETKENEIQFSMKLYKFYLPIRNGEWVIRNKRGEKIGTEKWENGVPPIVQSKYRVINRQFNID